MACATCSRAFFAILYHAVDSSMARTTLKHDTKMARPALKHSDWTADRSFARQKSSLGRIKLESEIYVTS